MFPRQEKNAREKRDEDWGLQGVVVVFGSLFVLWEAPLCPRIKCGAGFCETSPPA